MEWGIYFRTPPYYGSGVPQQVRVLSLTFAHKKAQDFSWALMVVFWFTRFRNLHRHGGIRRTFEDVLSR